METRGDERIAQKFEAAWTVFASTCAQFIAPEPTYQAWFAHYLISQFGIDRVAREPMIKEAAFEDSAWKAKVVGDHVRLDVVVMSQPGVHLPHYASIDRAKDGTGLERLSSMAVISELKVTATQGGGQSHTEVARDAYKLSMLLDELGRSTPSASLPLAFLCVLDNHPRKVYNQSALQAHFDRLPHHPGVRLLVCLSLAMRRRRRRWFERSRGPVRLPGPGRAAKQGPTAATRLDSLDGQPDSRNG